MRRCRTCLSFLLSWFSLQIAEPVLPYALAFKVSLHPELAYFSVFEAIKMSTKQLRLSMRRCRTCLSFLLSWFSLQIAEPVLPYALAFAAGAMVYVVVDDIIPEAQTR